MNRKRRGILKKIVIGLKDLLSPAIWDLVPASLREYANKIEIVCDEEEEAADSLPENMQMSQRYDDMWNNVSDLADANADLLVIADELDTNPKYDKDNQYKKDVGGVIDHIESAINR